MSPSMLENLRMGANRTTVVACAIAVLFTASATWLVTSIAAETGQPDWPYITQCQVVHPEDLDRDRVPGG